MGKGKLMLSANATPRGVEREIMAKVGTRGAGKLAVHSLSPCSHRESDISPDALAILLVFLAVVLVQVILLA